MRQIPCFRLDHSPKWRRPRGDWKLGVWHGMGQRFQLKMASSVTIKIIKCAESWLKKKKGRKKGDKYFLEGYLEEPKILIDDDICLVKAKCYRSMLKNEKQHELKIIFNVTGHICSVLATNCSCM